MSEPFLAEIIMFGGNFAPRGWAFCDGQLLPISQYTALFSILGTTYGGDGRTTFALPDLRGRIPMHPGNGPGLSPHQLGERSGAENTALSAAQMPNHSHSAMASFNEADSASPQNKVWALPTEDVKSYGNAGAGQTMAAGAIGNTGGNQAHTNIQPYLCVNFIIALQGIFPSRSSEDRHGMVHDFSVDHPRFNSAMSITLRPECPEDESFLFDLYSSTRIDELSGLGWTTSQQEMFLKMQFNARKQYYREQFPEAYSHIILLNNLPVGRIMVMRWDDEIRLLDIALLPEYRNTGIGTELIQKLLNEASEMGKPVSLHVQKSNPAIHLYERLGFARIIDNGVDYIMRWSAKNIKNDPRSL